MKFKHLLGPLPNALSAGSVTLIFLAFFVALCWFVYRRERKATYSHIERLPLEDSDHD